jgi:putative membrane protein
MQQETLGRGNGGWWIIVAVLILIVLVVLMIGGILMGPGMMDGYLGSRFGWFWGLGLGLRWLMMLAFWGGLIAVAVLLFRVIVGTSQKPATPSETALDILKRRFAAGEITREQYDEMRQALQQ